MPARAPVSSFRASSGLMTAAHDAAFRFVANTRRAVRPCPDSNGFARPCALLRRSLAECLFMAPGPCGKGVCEEREHSGDEVPFDRNQDVFLECPGNHIRTTYCRMGVPCRPAARRVRSSGCRTGGARAASCDPVARETVGRGRRLFRSTCRPFGESACVPPDGTGSKGARTGMEMGQWRVQT